MFDLMEEIEKSLKMPQRGELVKGEVIQVGPREVYVNLGCKKDGIIPFYFSFKDKPSGRTKNKHCTANRFFSLAVLGVKRKTFQGFR